MKDRWMFGSYIGSFTPSIGREKITHDGNPVLNQQRLIQWVWRIWSICANLENNSSPLKKVFGP